MESNFGFILKLEHSVMAFIIILFFGVNSYKMLTEEVCNQLSKIVVLFKSNFYYLDLTYFNSNFVFLKKSCF